ncbi:MAG: potassium channel family protein [Vallitaleaceae bacterium]|nr:potassium channel family protein [Vallitaleaceae bacterium]
MKYHVDIVSEPFNFRNGLISPKTAIITFFDVHGNQTQIKRYGFFDLDTQPMLKSTATFPLMDQYFKDFSVVKYRDHLAWDDFKTIHNFNAEKCFFDGDSDFSDVTFGKGGFSLAHSIFGNGQVNFQNTLFLPDVVHLSGINFGTGEKLFTSARFLGKTINFFSTNFGDGNVNFKCSNFINANLNFSGAIFGAGDVDFDFSTFGSGGVDFSGVSFGKGQVSFRNAQFNHGDALFFGSSFGEGKFTCSDAIFGDGNVDFSFCKFEKCIIHFKYATLGLGKFNMSNIDLEDGYILFKAVEFKGKVINFTQSKIERLMFINGFFTEHVNLSLQSCKELVVENCIIEKTFDLLASSKRTVSIECLNLLNTKNLGQIYVDWNMNNVEQMIYNQGKQTNYIDKANQFRLLKENFHNIGHYNDEDDAYVEFKRCLSKSELSGEDLLYKKHKKLTKIGRALAYPMKWFVLDFIGNYATNPFRILWTMLVTVLLFTFIYTLPFVTLQGGTEYAMSIESPFLRLFVNALYHSIETIFTIGYGDVSPGNIIAMILSGLEGFSGLFLMSYFTVAFVRKILR